jgi:hypothetical protein
MVHQITISKMINLPNFRAHLHQNIAIGLASLHFDLSTNPPQRKSQCVVWPAYVARSCGMAR